jgi:putative transposase
MTAQLITTREERGQAIAKLSGQINRIDEYTYTVKSQSGNGEYCISKVCGEWLCECPDNAFRHVKCKHILAVEFSKAFRAEVAINRVLPIESFAKCVFCGSSNLKKDGLRKNKSGNIQKYQCLDCHKHFSFNIGFEYMKHSPQAITSAMQIYFAGCSFRNTQKSLKLLGYNVSHKTVYRWVKRYISLMTEYIENLKPKISDTVRADELYLRLNGDMRYLFSMIDDSTRYWLAQEVGETKDKHDARQLFIKARRVMGKQPKTLITDGLPTYSVACRQIFPKTNHIRKITFDGKVHNNNKMERFNGEIRDREKTMRGLKKKDTAILQGYMLFHNFLRPHMALDGKTPAEACGIKVEGENKWLTLIQNAIREKRN